MREIKFRGKSNVSNKWFEGNLQINKDGCCIITPDKILLGSYGSVEEETVGQYTGLKDKNGKEIFEGDIIHIPDDWEKFGWASGENYLIYFLDGRFRLKPKYNSNVNGYDLENIEELEVIGNIYDNPELLNND